MLCFGASWWKKRGKESGGVCKSEGVGHMETMVISVRPLTDGLPATGLLSLCGSSTLMKIR